MDPWMKVAWAVLIGAMVVLLIPRVREMVDNSRKGTAGDWLSALIPLGLVGAFVALLVLSLR